MNPHDPRARFLPKNLRPKPDPQIAIRALFEGAKNLDVRAMERACLEMRDNGTFTLANVKLPNGDPPWRPVMDAVARRPHDVRAAVAALTFLRDKQIELTSRDGAGVSLAQAISTDSKGPELAKVWTNYVHWRARARAVFSPQSPVRAEPTRSFWVEQVEAIEAAQREKKLDASLPPAPTVPRPRV